MPDDDGQDWTCKHLLEGDCWKHFKSVKCPYPAYDKMQRCKEFKRVMKW